MSALSYRDFFAAACGDGRVPYPYQERLACEEPFPELLDVPTGLGKTAAAVLAWVWRRRFHNDKVKAATPRRLVYCLPMRVLVEQTYSETRKWLCNLGLLAETPHRDENDTRAVGWAAEHGDHGYRIAVHLLMGGEDATDWALWPERDAILLGTQDMLLSRALNRGYAASRARWPMEFGLLNNDCLWVFDEVQLMGPGLATGLQLEAFRSDEIDGRVYFGTAKRCASLYMSATASRALLASREWRRADGDKRRSDFSLGLSSPEKYDRQGALGERRLATKHLECQSAWSIEDGAAAKRIVSRHEDMLRVLVSAPPEIPRRTLVICNTVDRARAIHAALRGEFKDSADETLVLLHSRFRPPDRSRQQDRLKAKLDIQKGQIVVATQVVEAGVDLSSAIMWTEVAPLPSIVQRLGRLNRGGEFGHAGQTKYGWTPITVLLGVPLHSPPASQKKEEKQKHEKEITRAYLPYDRGECEAAAQTLQKVLDVSPANLETELRSALDSALRPPDYSLQRHELLDFFDTDSNLSLGYTDVSPFVRGIDPETDIYVLWRQWEGDSPPFYFDIGRQEICQVPIWHVIGKNGLSSWGQGFVWMGRERGWQQASRDNLLPGATLLLPLGAGGYTDTLGWTGNSADNIQITDMYVGREHPTDEDLLSSLNRGWQSVDSHTRDVRATSKSILGGLAFLDEAVRGAIDEAIVWHDYGKVIDGWQDATRRVADAAGLTWPTQIAPIAKFSFHESPLLTGLTCSELKREVWRLKCSFAPRLRHEVASALALRQHHRNGQPELTISQLLAQYLVMSHHGHVRKTLRDELPRDPSRARREGNTVRGIRDGASVKAVSIVGQDLPATPALSIACRQMGRGPDGEESWTRSVLLLLDHFGPFRLAYFEALVRAADCRASANPSTGIVTVKPIAVAKTRGVVSGGAR